jgi:integrase
MPNIYQTIAKLTGKPHPLWRYEFYDHLGRKRKGTGTTSRKETEKIAAQVQGKQYAIRCGVAAAPKSTDEVRNVDQVIAEYLRWGNTQGGRRGHPWGSEHARKREQNLKFWKEELSLRTQMDLIDCQSRVERVIHCLHITAGRSGKTTWNRVETLQAFCRWCVNRDYLADDPLRKLTKINTDPIRRRRPLDADEIGRLLQTCLPERVLLYEIAICSGLRANELRHITPRHLDVFRVGLRLEASWTKNRLDGFQPIPRWLMDKLLAAAAGVSPDAPLFSVQKSHAARMQADDLERAGIPIFKPGEGKVVFHSLRMSYCSLLDDHGASAKTTQELARHSTPTLTMNVYVRTKEDRVRGVVEALGATVRQAPASPLNPNGIPAQEAEMRKAL